MALYMTDCSCLPVGGSMERTVAKEIIPAGDYAIIRAAGGQMLWMPAKDASDVRSPVVPGTKLLVEGSSLDALGSLPCGRAVLASPLTGGEDSLFAREPDDTYGNDGSKWSFNSRDEVIAEIDTRGWRDFFEEVYLRSPEEYFQEYSTDEPDVWLWVMDDLHSFARTKGAHPRQARTSTAGVAVGADPATGEMPGVAMGSVPGGIEIVLVNGEEEGIADLARIMNAFAPHVSQDGMAWTVDTSGQFSGDKGYAYASLVSLHQLLSSRGTVPGLFRDLRDWVAGRI